MSDHDAMVGLTDGLGSFAAAGTLIDVAHSGTVWALTPTFAGLDNDREPRSRRGRAGLDHDPARRHHHRRSADLSYPACPP